MALSHKLPSMGKNKIGQTLNKARISEVFKPLYTSNRRYVLLTGGRGSLKSTTVHDCVARLTYEKGHGILFTRYTMTSAEKSIIPEFKICLDRLGIESDFHITQNTITNIKTGSFIYFSGIKTSSGNQTANLKSIAGITTWIIEEGEDFQDEKAFDTIDNSIRTSGKQNRIIWIQNPTTREHFIYKRFIKDHNKQIQVEGYNVTVSDHPDVEHIHTTYHLAKSFGYLNQSWIKKAEDLREKAIEAELKEKNAKYKSKYYYDYIGGWLERAEGVIFDYTIGKFDETLPYCFTLDWGYSPDPLACGKIAVDKRNKKIYVQQKIYGTEIDDVVQSLQGANIQRRELIICDTSEPRTRAAIAKAGYNIHNAVKGPIVDDVRAIKEYEIILDTNSPDYKTEFDNYVWNDKKSSTPIDKFNHLIDGMRYGFNRLVSMNRMGEQKGFSNLT